MSTSQSQQSISTARAFYTVFRALPKQDRLAVARYILEDEEIKYSEELHAIPNEITLESFAEDKTAMPSFQSVEDLRKDLLS